MQRHLRIRLWTGVLAIALAACSRGPESAAPAPVRRTVLNDLPAMVADARAAAAEHHGIPESRLVCGHVFFPFTSVLPDDQSYRLSFIQVDTYKRSVDETNEVTSYKTVDVEVLPDGGIKPQGTSGLSRMWPRRSLVTPGGVEP